MDSTKVHEKMRIDEKIALCITVPVALVIPVGYTVFRFVLFGFSPLDGEYHIAVNLLVTIPMLATFYAGYRCIVDTDSRWAWSGFVVAPYWFGFFSMLILSVHWYLGWSFRDGMWPKCFFWVLSIICCAMWVFCIVVIIDILRRILARIATIGYDDEEY